MTSSFSLSFLLIPRRGRLNFPRYPLTIVYRFKGKAGFLSFGASLSAAFESP